MNSEQKLKWNTYMREYNKKNRDKINKVRRKYRIKNRDKIIEAKTKARRAKGIMPKPPKMNREEFLASKKVYRERTKGDMVKTKILKLKWYYENIGALSCTDCGMSFKGLSWFAEFHHELRPGDGRGMYDFITKRGYLPIVEELNQGTFLCPNCHKLRHGNRRHTYMELET